jgi:AraC family transcriptional regulator
MGFGIGRAGFARLGKIAIFRGMTASAKILASGPGWRVQDVVCTGTAADRPFEEEHRDFVIAAVTEGTFRYRSRQGAAIMAPGGLLFGNRGACFECGHEHAAGDRCLSFHFSPELMQTIIADIPGATKLSFETASLPPCEALAPVIAEAEAARERTDAQELEEIALTLAGAAVSAAAGARKRKQGPSRRDEKRVSEAIRLIEAEAERPISLAELADSTATSPYHFLRSFRAAAGMTPYQFLLRTRLHRAAVRLRTTDEPVSAIAYEAGFNDLSTFNRRFRRVMGRRPQPIVRVERASFSRRVARSRCNAGPIWSQIPDNGLASLYNSLKESGNFASKDAGEKRGKLATAIGVGERVPI